MRGLILLGLGLLMAGPASAQVVEYYHLDGLGNVRVVTDQQGNVVERHDYLPFGEECTTGPCASNPGVGAGQARKFTGKERDQETGLDYFGARYYGSKIARFTTVDPKLDTNASQFNPQRWNRYSYGLNNPVRFNDPDGREVPVVIDNKLYNMGLEGRATGTVEEGNRAFAGLILGTTTALFGPEMLAATMIAGQSCLFSAVCLGAVQETAEGLAGGPPRSTPAARAAEVHGVLDPIAQANRTTAVLRTGLGDIVAGGARDLGPAQRAALRAGEIAARAAGAHAEVTALQHAGQMGASPQALASTRAFCAACTAAIEKAGGIIKDAKTAIWP